MKPTTASMEAPADGLTATPSRHPIILAIEQFAQSGQTLTDDDFLHAIQDLSAMLVTQQHHGVASKQSSQALGVTRDSEAAPIQAHPSENPSGASPSHLAPGAATDATLDDLDHKNHKDGKAGQSDDEYGEAPTDADVSLMLSQESLSQTLASFPAPAPSPAARQAFKQNVAEATSITTPRSAKDVAAMPGSTHAQPIMIHDTVTSAPCLSTTPETAVSTKNTTPKTATEAPDTVGSTSTKAIVIRDTTTPPSVSPTTSKIAVSTKSEGVSLPYHSDPERKSRESNFVPIASVSNSLKRRRSDEEILDKDPPPDKPEPTSAHPRLWELMKRAKPTVPVPRNVAPQVQKIVTGSTPAESHGQTGSSDETALKEDTRAAKMARLLKGARERHGKRTAGEKGRTC